jgi:hypothetical protein
MEQQTAVDTVEALSENDTVTVSGNGLDVTATVEDISQSSWTGKLSATLKPTNGDTWTLTDADHPLQSDGITANVGAVTVKVHN